MMAIHAHAFNACAWIAIGFSSVRMVCRVVEHASCCFWAFPNYDKLDIMMTFHGSSDNSYVGA
ncbi:hypothetical protein PR001_g9027 [Phytophthora rubi]|uniref:Secreted protein n=1 Tax=Phytophthora rubi TaxID=129364 RepID=A0A6A3KEQ1_9STRA|nr:hypothetical protein PR002_g17411 [Phytophthora rubi]KAE9036021.1 hypothetical protein PR001_g9027 [Phytophthora rubi]